MRKKVAHNHLIETRTAEGYVMNKFPRIYYYASKKEKFIEINHAPVNGVSEKVTKPVSGKAEARKLTKELGGVAWNF